ncbi:MAG: nuclear transport factor 2 family protein [Actinomycetes bacterium]
MPWLPELFSAPALEQLLEKRRKSRLASVPYFDGLFAGELDALVSSFAGEPVLYDPVRGRVRGVRAFEEYCARMRAWLGQHASVEDVHHVVLEDRGFEEVVLHLYGEAGHVDLPYAVVADHPTDGRIEELRIYYSTWPLTGRHAIRPPLLQPDAGLREPGILAEYERALAAGDVDAILATFESDGSLREPAGAEYLHSGLDRLSAFYEPLFSNGGIPLETCGLVDDGHACALEYNVVGWGTRQLPPQAGLGVFVRGESGRLAAVRLYDDVDRPSGMDG